MAIKGAGKKSVELPKWPYFDAIERNGKWVFNCLVKPCTFRTTEPHGLKNHLEMVHKQCLDVQTIIGVLPQDKRPTVVTPIEQHIRPDDPRYTNFWLAHQQQQNEAIKELMKYVANDTRSPGKIKFDAILGEDGRLTIPEPTRILHGLKKGYVLTLSIENIMERKKEDAS
jgi:hypothetical protein